MVFLVVWLISWEDMGIILDNSDKTCNLDSNYRPVSGGLVKILMKLYSNLELLGFHLSPDHTWQSEAKETQREIIVSAIAHCERSMRSEMQSRL